MTEEALQIAEIRREAKGKGERERYTHLNAEFQRIARRDKKAVLREQCKEIEKIEDTNGNFFVKMGSIKDRNGKDLTEAEELRKGGKNTQNCTKKVLMTQIITMVWSLI